MEAPGIEAAENLSFVEENSSFLNFAGSDLADSDGLSAGPSVGRSEKVIGDRNAKRSGDLVVLALSTALQRASLAGRWDVVAAIAAELAAHRLT